MGCSPIDIILLKYHNFKQKKVVQRKEVDQVASSITSIDKNKNVRISELVFKQLGISIKFEEVK